MNSRFFSSCIRYIKKTTNFFHASLCVAAQSALTWFSLEHFFHPLHIENRYVLNSFQIIKGSLTGASTAIAALTRGAELLETRDSSTETISASGCQKFLSFSGYWGLGWTGSWFIFLGFFTIINSILPEEDEPAFALEELLSLLVAISVRYGFLAEIAERLKSILLAFNLSTIYRELKQHPFRGISATFISFVYSFAQAYRTFCISSDSIKLCSTLLISSQQSTLISIGESIFKNSQTLCYFSANTIGLVNFLVYLSAVYHYLGHSSNQLHSIKAKLAIWIIYLDASIVAIENGLAIADFSLAFAEEEHEEFISYLSIITTFFTSFFASRCFNTSAQKNMLSLFNRMHSQQIISISEEVTPILSHSV